MITRICLAVASMSLVSCTTNAPPATYVDAETGQKVTRVAARDIPPVEISTNANGETVICRTDGQTGSRIRKTRMCGKKSEWATYDDLNEHYVREWTVDRGSGHGPSF